MEYPTLELYTLSNFSAILQVQSNTKKMRRLQHENVTWIDFAAPIQDDIVYLHENFNIHPLIIEEIVTPTYQPRVLQYDNCLFFSLHIPLFDVRERTTFSGELDIILTGTHLITAHRHSIYQIEKLFTDLEGSVGKRRLYLEGMPAQLVYRLMEILLNSCFPRLKHITQRLENIEHEVFAGKERAMVQEISIVKRDILNFRRALKPQRSIIESLIALDHPFLPRQLKPYFQDLVGTNIRVWNMLESSKETIEALEETNNSLLSNKLNQTMKVLTIFNAILLPLTVYSNVMSMNTHLPLMNNIHGFLIHLSIMGIASLITIGIFWWRKWF